MPFRRSLARLLVVALVAGAFVVPFSVERPAFAVTPEVKVEVIEGLGEGADGEADTSDQAPPESSKELSEELEDEARSETDQDESPATTDESEVESDESGELSGEKAPDEGDLDESPGDEGPDLDAILEPIETAIPFSMIGFETADEGGLWFRVSQDGAVWEDWQEAPFLDEEDGPDAAEKAAANDVTHFTDAAWVAEARHVQVRTEGIDPARLRIHLIDSMGLSRTVPQKVLDVGKALLQSAEPAQAEAATKPAIVTRPQWGADESLRNGSPSYASELEFAVVHHTAGTNDYTRSQSPGIVRGIYAYHTQSLGWNDIGYNFLVDRYGTVYEGRYGGMERAVIGAHARWYNSGSVGVSLMGNHEIASPTSISVDRMNDVIAWKFSLHGVDPNKTPTRSGVDHAVIAHRDVGSTACPGRYVYSQMSSIRSTVAARTLYGGGEITSNPPPSGAVPVTGDWNGDDQETPGWFRNGKWALYSRGEGVRLLDYGRSGDFPVVGDWNGDGVDTVGVVRETNGHLYFILRRTYVAGDDVVLRYGRRGDTPVTGDWNGDGIDTVGVVRADADDRLRFILRYVYRSGADIVMHYGRKGDIPVTGDFNGNGTDTLGVVRGNRFILRYEYVSGADIVMEYGRVGDYPLIGDWNGDGRATLGIRRGELWALRYAYRSGADIIYEW